MAVSVLLSRVSNAAWVMTLAPTRATTALEPGVGVVCAAPHAVLAPHIMPSRIATRCLTSGRLPFRGDSCDARTLVHTPAERGNDTDCQGRDPDDDSADADCVEEADDV